MEFPKRNKEVAGKEYTEMKLEDVKKKVKEGKYRLITHGAEADHYADLENKKEFVFNKRTGKITDLQSEQLGGTFRIDKPKENNKTVGGVGFKKNFPD